ncbi:protein of unknown function [Agreia sp. COWG]|nr:protein of unknown function [Agreia sp. COWG]
MRNPTRRIRSPLSGTKRRTATLFY